MKKLINVNVNYLKIPKRIAGRTKRPRAPHAARVFETPGLLPILLIQEKPFAKFAIMR